MANTRNTIVLKGRLDRRYEEAVAGNGNIKPGYQIYLRSDGKVVPYDVAGGDGLVAIAVEDALQGKTILDTYANNSIVRFHLPVKGDMVYVQLKQGQNIITGRVLTPNGDGTFKGAASGGTDKAVLMAAEAVNAASADDWIAAWVI